jgi:cytochrome bd-type quinol oxidase subunit 1
MIALSLSVFVLLYATLAVVYFLLMRRYARFDPPQVGEEAPVPSPEPALSY